MRQQSQKHFARMSAAEFKRRAPEKSIQSAICGLLRLIGIPFSVTDAALVFDNSGNVAGRAVLSDGWPDVTGSLPPAGRMLAVETKSIDGKLRPSQIACHAALRQSGALVFVPRSVEEFARSLSEVGIQHSVITQLLNKSRTMGVRK